MTVESLKRKKSNTKVKRTALDNKMLAFAVEDLLTYGSSGYRYARQFIETGDIRVVQFKKLVGVSKSSIDIILDEYLVHNPLTHPNSTKFLRPLDRIIITMFHMRHYTSDIFTGFLFRISRTAVNRVKMAMIEYLFSRQRKSNILGRSKVFKCLSEMFRYSGRLNEDQTCNLNDHYWRAVVYVYFDIERTCERRFQADIPPDDLLDLH
ncbi:hypothetical protein PPL_01392 [Heterostelium album PN500]|uniref:Transposase Helix-turn-helix domain-containing protein n=1 Tax=Heterostelium pallidum (strain ATCC 26659 / Pp 5 / PN500) TaxID=670386 RepID=D3AZ52_HETP5|nr:hypothetical protein PPL_01392 [Heterostelium album PN500]EFA85609.1 hypothetical protein PPL_01392 [Heterostelium album PN500]|eukprot:XP_020437716.1 hypothetical protein PPL_01392 [Heterostelium album PN500]